MGESVLRDDVFSQIQAANSLSQDIVPTVAQCASSKSLHKSGSGMLNVVHTAERVFFGAC